MNRNEILSGIAITASIVAIITMQTAVKSNKEHLANIHEQQQLLDDKIEASAQNIREELVEKLDRLIINLDLQEPAGPDVASADLVALAREARNDPALTQLLQKGIESVIVKEMAAELGNVDWLDEISQEKLQKLLQRSARNSLASGFTSFQNQEPLDVSDIDNVEGKINRILEEFENVNTYSSNNALVKQIAAMGEEAVAPLLALLNDGQTGHVSWAKRRAVTDALEKLLTEKDQDIILAEFTKNGNFSKLIKKYQFPAAEEEVMSKIIHPAKGSIDRNVVDAALRMNAERAIPLLIEQVSYGNNVAYAAQQLSDEGVEITEPLRMAAARTQSIWEKAGLADLCLERNMPEGYDLAIQVLRSNEQHSEHSKEQVFKSVKKHIGITGTYEEAADWLEQNRI